MLVWVVPLRGRIAPRLGGRADRRTVDGQAQLHRVANRGHGVQVKQHEVQATRGERQRCPCRDPHHRLLLHAHHAVNLQRFVQLHAPGD